MNASRPTADGLAAKHHAHRTRRRPSHGRGLLRLALLGAMLWAALPGPAIAAADGMDAAAPARPSPALKAALNAYATGHLADAARRFERLARAGEPVAMHDLAVMHLRGELPQPDLAQARALLERAATSGFVTAQLALAELLESGRLGAIDLGAALGWYRLAAELGNVDAQLALATANYLGRGTPRDEAQALHWYREAAKAGDGGAQYLVASMYETGLGTAVDLRLARYWYDLASRQRDPAAALKRDAIDRLLAAAGSP
jgi:uncharacterized protein